MHQKFLSTLMCIVSTGCSKKSYTRALFGSPLLYLFTEQVNILEPGR